MAYQIYFVGIQTPFLDFCDAHSDDIWHGSVILIGRGVYQGYTKRQICIATGTIVAIECERRNRKGKRATEGSSQIKVITPIQGFPCTRPRTRSEVVIRFTCRPASYRSLRFLKSPRMYKSTNTISSIYLTRTPLTVVLKIRSSRHCADRFGVI